MPAPEEVTLGDKRVELSTFDRFKGRKGTTDRGAIISSTLLRANSHFFNNKTFRCLTTDPTNPAICCKQCGAPNQKFGLTLFQYVADPNGEIIVPEKCQGTVKIWIISESRFQELSQLHAQWPLLDTGFDQKQHDLIMKCSEEQYQRFTFTPSPKAHWKSKEAWYKALKGKEALAKDRIALALGKKLTEVEVMELLGASVPQQTGTTSNANDIDLSDVIG